MTHHPDCEFWFDYTNRDCSCGHTQPRPAWSTLEPWTVEAMDEWRREVRLKLERANAQLDQADQVIESQRDVLAALVRNDTDAQ